MAPIEPELYNDNTWPLFVLGSYGLLTIAIISFIVDRVLYRSYIALPPSQATRTRQTHRLKHLIILAVITTASLSIAIYHIFSVLTVSYQVWAYERGDLVPSSIFPCDSCPGIFNSDGSLALQLGRWWAETSPFSDAWEIALSNSRRRWWTQQLFQGRTAWSMYVALDARRRNIPHAWAFILLVGWVSLSFAEGLYGLAVLLTPVALPDSSKRPEGVIRSPSSARGGAKHTRKSNKSSTQNHAGSEDVSILGRVESSLVYIVRRFSLPQPPARFLNSHYPYTVTILLFTTIGTLLHLAPQTESFDPLLGQSFLALFLPLYLTAVAPANTGPTATSLSAATEGNWKGDGSYNNVPTIALYAFRALALVSLPLHISRTVIAVIDNAQPRHKHWYFLRDRPSALRQASGGLGRVLGGFSDHPACGYVAWDALMSATTMFAWAGLRGLDVEKMMKGVGWVWDLGKEAVKGKKELERGAEKVKEGVKKVVGKKDNDDDDDEKTAPKSGKSKSRRKMKDADGDGEDDDAAWSPKISTRSSPKSPGKSKGKTKFRDADGDGVDDDAEWLPSGEEGDEQGKAIKREHRKSEPKKSPKSGGSRAEETEQDAEEPVVEEGGEMGRTYPGDSGAEVWKGDEDRKEDWEAAAMSWGMLIVGGLGVQTAGVLGGEVLA